MATGYDDIALVKEAEAICDEIWECVHTWRSFDRETVGSQLVRAADSVGANIAESYGRYNYGEKIQFLYYARGSIYETKYWLNRTLVRKLMSPDQAHGDAARLEHLAKGVNAFINNLRSQRRNQGRSDL